MYKWAINVSSICCYYCCAIKKDARCALRYSNYQRQVFGVAFPHASATMQHKTMACCNQHAHKRTQKSTTNAFQLHTTKVAIAASEKNLLEIYSTLVPAINRHTTPSRCKLSLRTGPTRPFSRFVCQLLVIFNILICFKFNKFVVFVLLGYQWK